MILTYGEKEACLCVCLSDEKTQSLRWLIQVNRLLLLSHSVYVYHSATLPTRHLIMP